MFTEAPHRAALESLRADVVALAQSLHEREQDVITRVEAGVPVDGVAKVIDRRRQNISWLTVVKRMLGEDAVKKAKDEWPMTFYKELQIGE